MVPAYLVVLAQAFSLQASEATKRESPPPPKLQSCISKVGEGERDNIKLEN